MTFTFDIAFKSVPGSEHAYQDRLLVNRQKMLFAVADGVSIPDYGDSAKAAERALSMLANLFSMDLKHAIDQVNNEIAKIRKTENLGLTTLTAIHIFQEDNAVFATFANVGDSPAYLLRNGRLSIITELDTNGLYLTSEIGEEQGEVHCKKQKIENGDMLIAATDGIEPYLSKELLVEMLRRNDSAEDIVDRIFSIAAENKMSYDDDKTLICIIAHAGGEI